MNQPGKSLGVIGLGGLGHLAVKFGKAFGLRVTVFSTSISKKEEALNLLGADKFVVSSDEQQMMVKIHPTSYRAWFALISQARMKMIHSLAFHKLMVTILYAGSF